LIQLDQLQKLAKENGTPLFVVDHDEIRRSYQDFKRQLPRVTPHYAVKANPDPAIVETLFKEGASFDVASLPEFEIVYQNIKDMSPKQRQAWVEEKIILANTIKLPSTLEKLDWYHPLMTFDNINEIHKIKQHSPHARLVLRLRVSNTGAMVELSSKFGAGSGEAVDLIFEAMKEGLDVEGISFHVGSQTSNFDNYVQALRLTANVFEEAKSRGYYGLHIVDIGGGFPVAYDASVKPFSELTEIINSELKALFPEKIKIIAEPGRFMVANSSHAVSEVIGVAKRDGKPCYYINDGVYHTYSGIIFDHCHYPIKAFKDGPKQISAVFGPTCDALDVISTNEKLPELQQGDLVYSDRIGAYSNASATYFNGFPPAKVVNVNQ
jgi:ornithine decarboxylase